ncbi:MAG TPA: hypothetical protein HA264_00280 [Methanolinea sp.]|nr:hypothetical protein [Methanolinea sp.]
MSTEVKAGKLVFVVGIVIGCALVFLLVSAGAASTSSRLIPIHLVAEYLYILLALKITGLVLAIFSVYFAEKKCIQRAGVIGLVASLLPPVDILFLLGSLLFFVSPETRGSTLARDACPGTQGEERYTDSDEIRVV